MNGRSVKCYGTSRDKNGHFKTHYIGVICHRFQYQPEKINPRLASIVWCAIFSTLKPLQTMKKFIHRCHEQAAIKAAVKRICRYCPCRQKFIIRRILKLEAYRRNAGYCLTVASRQLRNVRVKQLLQRHKNGCYREILFANVKKLTVELSKSQRKDFQVWVSFEKVTQLHFCAQGSTTCNNFLNWIEFSTKVMLRRK